MRRRACARTRSKECNQLHANTVGVPDRRMSGGEAPMRRVGLTDPMARKQSAGLLLYRRRPRIQLLIAHMGGPFWARKDEHAWSIPKGEYALAEDAFVAACREFAEELGSAAPNVDYLELGAQKLPGGKVLTVWAGESDLDTSTVVSNTFELQWPPHSGRLQAFPEIDRAEWVTAEVARRKLVTGQVVFVNRLLAALGDRVDTGR